MKKLRFWKTVFKGDGDTPSSQVKLALLSIIVGGLAGLGAVLFRDLVAVFHNLLFSAKFSFIYDASRHTSPNPWGIAVILVPVLGGLGVSFLVKRFGQEIRGSGVPEVVDSVYYNKGRIHPRIPITKTLASSLSIGSGASVGREGPILQIGSALGSWVAQVLRLPVWQRVSLLAAGAAGGIAATFNTPIGGILFAVEIIMPEFSSVARLYFAGIVSWRYFSRLYPGSLWVGRFLSKKGWGRYLSATFPWDVPVRNYDGSFVQQHRSLLRRGCRLCDNPGYIGWRVSPTSFAITSFRT
jgi:H+/Cl- antiporter ClcA